MTSRQKAAVRAKLATKPSMEQMRRIADAMATPGVAVCHARGRHGDWHYDVYDSACVPGQMQVNAWRQGATLGEMVADLAAARAWLRLLP